MGTPRKVSLILGNPYLGFEQMVLPRPEDCRRSLAGGIGLYSGYMGVLEGYWKRKWKLQGLYRGYIGIIGYKLGVRIATTFSLNSPLQHFDPLQLTCRQATVCFSINLSRESRIMSGLQQGRVEFRSP